MSKNGHSQVVSAQSPANPMHENEVKLESGEKKRKGGGWITTPFIFGCEGADGLAGFGASANLVIFLTLRMHMKTLSAATVLNGISAMTTVSSLFSAYFADAYLGRFTTIALGSLINLAGLFTLTIVAWDKTLHPASCNLTKSNVGASVGACQKASALQMGILYLAFALMAIGSGAIRPCIGPFGASQFDQTHPEEKKQLKHYFNWFFFTLTFSILLATTVFVYIQDKWGFALGFGILSIIFLLMIIFFFSGMRLYRYNPPQGSAFTRMAQVIVAAIRKRKLTVPEDPSKLYVSGTVDGDESEELEKPSSDDDEAEKRAAKAAKCKNGVNLAKSPIGFINLAEGGQNSVAGASSARDEKLGVEAHQPEKLEVEKNAGSSKASKRDENLDEKRNVSEKLYNKKSRNKNATEELHLEETPKAMSVGPYHREDDGSVTVLRHSDQFRFFDKAAIAVAQDWSNSYGKDGQILRSRTNRWTLCSVHQVEELKCMVRLVPIWVTLIPVAMAIAIGGSYGVVQAASMDRHLGKHFLVPAASFSFFSTLTVLIWLPIYDKKVVPLLRRYTGKERGITFLQKIGLGTFLLIFGHVVATLVEHKRREAARHHGLADKPHAVVPISAFWLLPQHVIYGLSESFVIVGGLEFFYYMLPEHLTTTGYALFLATTAIGSSMNTVLLHSVQKITRKPGHPGWLDNNINRAHLDYFLAVLTACLVLDFFLFLVVARWYKRQRHLNQMMDGIELKEPQSHN
ncbi:unnamed protein product [Calypogeia fissa]